MFRLRCYIFLTGLLTLATTAFAEKLKAADLFLEKHSLTSLKKFQLNAQQEALLEKIQNFRDPETKFGSYIFGLNKPKITFLTEPQKEQVQNLIEAKKSGVNWHDVRNVVRIHHMISMWEVIKNHNSKSEDTSTSEMNKWLDIFINYMFQEFIVREKFQKDYWNTLSPEQQKQLQNGKYDSYIVKNSGHKRVNNSHKIIIKVLGKPDQQEAFNKHVESLRETWTQTSSILQKAEKVERQRNLFLDLQDEQFSHWAWSEYSKAFKLFKESEFDALLSLLSHYPDPKKNKKMIEAYQEKLRRDMLKKYQSGASELLKKLGY